MGEWICADCGDERCEDCLTPRCDHDCQGLNDIDPEVGHFQRSGTGGLR